MKKHVKFLSMALAILMILPMLLALPVNATEPEVGYFNSKAYDEAADGELLYKADFRGDTHWTPSVSSNDNYNDVTMEASGDGNSATFTSLGTNSKRAMWGGDLTPDLPLSDGVQYTFLFHLVLSSSNTPYFGYYLDGTQGIVIKGDRKANLFQWGSTKKTATVTGWISWGDKTDIEGLEQDFAVTFDYDTKTSALYVKNSKGSYTQVLETVLFDETLDGATALSVSFFAQGSKADATATVSDFRIYKGVVLQDRVRTVNGAAVRLDNPTGLRFTGLVDRTYLNGLKATYGAENVKIGMVITPTEFLTNNSLDFTLDALDGCGAIAGMKYAKIEATTILEDNDEDAYKINCVLSDVKAENYTHAFSAITYVEVNGEIVAYSNYSESLNSRSIASVAEAAYNDISDTQTGEYQYQIGDTSTYSPYTEEQRAILQSFFQ